MSSRARSILVGVGFLALAILIGVILNNVWLGLALGLLVGLVVFMSMESKRGGNKGVNDEDHGAEL